MSTLSTLEAATVLFLLVAPEVEEFLTPQGRTWRLYKWKAPTQPGVSTQWCHHLGGWCTWAWIEEFRVYNSGRLSGGWELWTQTPNYDLGAQLLATSPVPALPPVPGFPSPLSSRFSSICLELSPFPRFLIFLHPLPTPLPRCSQSAFSVSSWAREYLFLQSHLPDGKISDSIKYP